ncbi:hypothetical protein RhiirA5_419114 [Rhizophagus irregularis]|uniref:Uncharacterized protein n=1 Tax=Rhizophagus irregularis TaxID=588596 RepID=A0A2N0PIZ5_9GLOM|nr:hypothetical protein RhiirA5_419114 [Rhizophagus irregularis]
MAWRTFKLRSEIWAKQVWNMKYDLHTDEYADCIKKAYNENIAQKYIKEYLAKRVTGYKEYNYYYSSNWAEISFSRVLAKVANETHSKHET